MQSTRDNIRIALHRGTGLAIFVRLTVALVTIVVLLVPTSPALGQGTRTPDQEPAQDPRVVEILAAVSEERWSDAITGIDQLLVEVGEDPTLLLWLGNAERARGDMAAASNAYLRGLAVSPTDLELIIALGQIHQFTGNLPAAREIYALAIEVAPELPVVHRLAAAVEVDWENPALAAGHLRRYLELDPDDVRARIVYGIQLFENQQHDEAIEQFELVLALNPNDPGARYGLGAVLADRPARHEEAVQHLREAVRIVPENIDAHYVLGRVLIDLGRFEEALASLERTVELDPDHAQAHYRLALAHRQLGNRDESRAMQARFLELSQAADADDHGYKQVKTLFNAVSAALESGDVAAVDRALDELLTQAPDNADAYVVATKIRLSAGDIRGALEAAGTAVGLDETHWEAQYLLGMILYRAGRPEAARGPLQASLDGNPLFPDGHAMLGNVLVALRNHRAAVEAYQAALTLEPENPNHHLNLATVYRRLGDETKESEHMAEYQRLVAAREQEQRR